MKRLLIFFIVSVLFSSIVSAGGVGISPAYYKDFFESGLEKEYTFHSFNTNPEGGISLYVKGDLSQYVNLSKSYILGSGEFIAKIKLPNEIEKPGVHKISIGAIEAEGEFGGGNIGGIAAIQGRIDILVPYPGKYAEATFKISNINQGEMVPYEIEIQNLGTESLKVKSMITIFKSNSTEILLTKKLSEIDMVPKQIANIIETLDTKDFPPGEYQAFVSIDWDEKIINLNQTFRVGEFLVEIIDYDYQFYEGRINPFNIQIQNKWNSKIDEVFAEVSITDEGRVVGGFKTVSVETSPWETKNITGYLDASNLETKRYVARIILSYGGETSSKLVAIYINSPPTKTYKKYIIMAIIIAVLIISAFIYLIWDVHRLSKKNEKKK